MPRQLDGPDGLHTESGITPEKSNSSGEILMTPPNGPDGLHTESELYPNGGIKPQKSNSFSLVKLFLHILN